MSGSLVVNLAQPLVNASLVGSGIWEPEKLYLTGTGNYLSVPYSNGLHINDYSTIFFVGTAKSTTITQRIFQSDSAPINYTGVIAQIDSTSGKPSISMGDNSGVASSNRRSTVTTSATITVGVEHSIAFVNNGFTAASNIYLNGVNQSVTQSGTATGPISIGTLSSSIGRLTFGSNSYYSDYSYKLLLVYNRQLTALEVQQLYINTWQIFKPQLIPFLSQPAATIAIWCKVAGSLKQAEALWIKTGGNLKAVTGISGKVSGSLKSIA